MRKTTTLLALFAVLAAGALGQEGSTGQTMPQVSLSANMMDVRTVINTIFTQVKKNYVLENGVMGSLNLALTGVEFDEALNIVLKQANLKFELQNGIYFISKVKPAAAPTQTSTKPQAPISPPKPKGQIAIGDLNKKVTTRLTKTDIRVLFAELTRQTGVEFEIAPKVPAYKLDAFLLGTSLKYALDTISHAAGLEYKLTDNQTILITKPADPNRVELIQPGDKSKTAGKLN